MRIILNIKWKFGKQIFEGKIKPILFPDEDLGQKPGNPFDFWVGQNFKLIIKDKGGYRNYDSSIFAAPTVLSDDDEELERIWALEHSLEEFIKPETYKSYEELEARLNEVLEVGTTSSPAKKSSAKIDDEAMKLDEAFPSGEEEELDLDSFLSSLDD